MSGAKDEFAMMRGSADNNANQLSVTHWRSLRYFGYYRVCLAGLLFVSSLFNSPALAIISAERGVPHLAVTGLYFLTRCFRSLRSILSAVVSTCS